MKFESVLLEAIYESFSVYGERTKSVVYKALEKVFGIPRIEIPSRIEEFSRALEDLFGLGSRFLEVLIMKNLHSKIAVVWGWKPSNPWVLPDLTFKEYVNFIRKYFGHYFCCFNSDWPV